MFKTLQCAWHSAYMTDKEPLFSPYLPGEQ